MTESSVDERLIRQAEERVKAKRGFRLHLLGYILLNVFLVIIYFATNSGYFWPVWAIFGSGIGLFMHGFAVYGLFGQKLEKDIQLEYQRLKNNKIEEHDIKTFSEKDGKTMENEVDEKLMHQAEERVKSKRAFRSHFWVYFLVNAFFVIIYFVTSPGQHFWPIWCISGWGIGLLWHGLSVYVKFPGKTLEEEIEIEYQRLQKNKNEEHK